jgi:hypothetical protein
MLVFRAISFSAILALGLAACGGSGTHQAATTHVYAPAAATTVRSTTPPSPPALLTIKQAAGAYVRIGDLSNRLSEAINRDYSDAAPFSQYRADALALVKALSAASRKFRALHWPATVQPYITAILLIYVPAFVRCAKAGAEAGSTAAAVTIAGSNQDCTVAADSTIPDRIRLLLGLRATEGTR